MSSSKTEVKARRPVVAGFFPDPSVCRVGDTYWMACSSFEYAPGVPLFRSTDLLNWEQVGNALTRPSQLEVGKAAPSSGIFAPTLRFHDGRFWMITTNWSDGQGQLLSWATDPTGEWSDPVRLPTVPGIDPELAWDDDGTCYLTWSNGPAGIFQNVIDPLTGAVLSEQRHLWSGTGGMYPEGPHLYHVGEHWYLLIAEGGTERGHAVTLARGPSPSGPFEAAPENPLLTARSTDLPVQNTGHGDLIQRPDGPWAMVYHGVRTRGRSPRWHVLGREAFAAEVVWVDGWPRLGAPIEPATDAAAEIEELTANQLPVSWIAPNRFPDEAMQWSGGRWRLLGPAFVGRRQQHLAARITATVDVRQGAGGIGIRIDPRHRFDIEADADHVRATAYIGGIAMTLGRAPVPAPGRVRLELRAVPVDETRGPDEIVADLLTDGGRVELGRLDGRYLSTEVAGGFTGRLAGLVASRGELTVLSFTYSGSDAPEVVDSWN